MKPAPAEHRTLDYGLPADHSIPVWKHLVFVPLLFWVALFIGMMFIVLIIGILGAAGVLQ